ncbi:MAG TPA: capsule assembly Wzi family protein [Gemmatimonadaceae bacterium]|nr:capsule assembly Wzi family protein [Gemmatimonadaceae bacterium]
MYLSRNIRHAVAYTLFGASSALGQNPPPAPKVGIDSTPRPAASRDTVSKPRHSLILVTSDSVDRLRTAQLRAGVASGQTLLLRSASTLTRGISKGGSASVLAIRPQFLAVINSAIPFSQNYGAMWAGKGLSSRTLFGARLETPHARIILAPELVISSNSDWVLRHDFYVPPLPPERSPYDLPFYVGDFTIDQPMRFGDKGIRRLDPGESSLFVKSDRFEFGFSNENEWWGPGIRNALVLSNNAPGFPHFVLRTARPLTTRLGEIEARWIVGGLTESAYFDTTTSNNTRSLAALALALRPAGNPNLSLGFARSVYSTSSGWGSVWGRWFDIFAHTTRDTTGVRKDQLFSLFARWVFPEDGVEIYGEWGRLRLQPSLRDFLISPNHTQGYTLGLQWRGNGWSGGDLRLQTEITQLEQSATFRDRPTPSWYTSTRVVQGYTNRGESLGASIGPGGQSQFVAADYVKSDWRVGTFGGRIRWNEDAHDNFGFPDYAAYCNQDVSMYFGLRGAKTGRLGSISSDLTIQRRLNAFFQNAGGCPLDRRLDIHNATLGFSYTPGG